MPILVFCVYGRSQERNDKAQRGQCAIAYWYFCGTLIIVCSQVLDVLCCPGVERSSGKVRAAFDLITVDRRWQFEATTREVNPRML